MSDTRYSEAGQPQSESLCICRTDKCIGRQTEGPKRALAACVGAVCWLIVSSYLHQRGERDGTDGQTDGRT